MTPRARSHAPHSHVDISGREWLVVSAVLLVRSGAESKGMRTHDFLQSCSHLPGAVLTSVCASSTCLRSWLHLFPASAKDKIAPSPRASMLADTHAGHLLCEHGREPALVGRVCPCFAPRCHLGAPIPASQARCALQAFLSAFGPRSSGASRYIIKQITRREKDALTSILPAYKAHVEHRHGRSLIQYFGCHSLSLWWKFSGKVYFVVMRDFFPVRQWLSFDLKGAALGWSGDQGVTGEAEGFPRDHGIECIACCRNLDKPMCFHA